MEIKAIKMRWKIDHLPLHLTEENVNFYSPVFESEAGRWRLMVKKQTVENVLYLSVYLDMNKYNEMKSANVEYSVTVLNSLGNNKTGNIFFNLFVN
jgi:hypothetical protein